MASIEESVVTRMQGFSELTDLIGDVPDVRLYPMVIPQNAALPAVAYQKISSPKTQSHSGSSHLAQSRFQFTCEAETYSDVKAVATAVRHCWDSFAGIVNYLLIGSSTIENDSDSERELGVQTWPVVRLDVVMWHQED